MLDEPRRKTRYRGERCTSKLTLNRSLLNVVLLPNAPDYLTEALPNANMPAQELLPAGLGLEGFRVPPILDLGAPHLAAIIGDGNATGVGRFDALRCVT